MIVFIAAEPRELLPWTASWKAVSRPGVYWSREGSMNSKAAVAIANGAGKSCSRIAARSVANATSLVSVGYCGALDPALRIGEIVLCSAPAVHPPARVGKLFTAERIVVNAAEKRDLHSRGFDAVDMEAAGVAEVAAERGVPFYCIKTVSDLAGEDLAIDFNRFLRQDGRYSVPRLVAHAALNPLKRFPELIRLSKRTSTASKNLGEFLARCTF